MKIPHKTIVLHWVERCSSWSEVPWADWVRFRGYDSEKMTSLPGLEAGEHFFVVCMLGVHDELRNVIPHRYTISENARLIHGFDGLDAAERVESERIGELTFPTIEEIERYDELGERGFSVNLPPHHTVSHLVQAMPGIARAQPASAL